MSKAAGITLRRAAAEFLVIFAGITISLLADDWRQSRLDREKELTALAEMASDLQADSIALERKLERVRQWDQTALWIRRRAHRRDLPADTVGRRIEPLFYIHNYQPVRSSYVGLRSAGNLDLIRNDSIRRLIVDYFEIHQPYMVQFNTYGVEWYNAFLDAARPFVLWTVDTAATSFRDTISPGRLVLQRPWTEITDDPIFMSESTWLGVHGATAAMRISTVLARNAELRTAILQYTQ